MTMDYSQILVEIIAGITVGVMAVPQGLSFASVAGLPPVYGLYNSISGCIPYFFLGTSPHLIVGPTAVMSLVVRSSIPRETSQGISVEEASMEWIGYATTMSFLAGIIQTLMGVLGLGIFVQLVCEPVMQGFVVASALLMIVSQMSSLVGVSKCNPSDLLGEGHDYDECYLQEYIASLWTHRNDIHVTTTLLSVGSVIILLGFKYLLIKKRPQLSRLGPIILSIITLLWFYIMCSQYGKEIDEKNRVFDGKWHVRLVGPIPSGLPHISNPFHSVGTFNDVIKVFTSSIVISILGFMESMAIASSIARQTKIGKLIPSRELLALGGSNLLCSVTKGYPITGSFSRTAVNADSGSKSQISALVSGLVITLVLVLFSEAIQYMPKFALAAIVVVSVLNLIRPNEMIILYRTNRVDFFSFFMVVTITMFAGFERGLACGVLVSWVGTMMHRLPLKLELLRFDSNTYHDVPSSNFNCVDICILKLDNSLLFSNIVPFENAFERCYLTFSPKCIMLDLTKCSTIDASGIQALEIAAEFAFENLHDVKCLYVIGLSGSARRVAERANSCNKNLHWNLAPIVGGIGDSFPPRLVTFETIQNALDYAKNKVKPKDENDPTQQLTTEAYELVEEAKLSAWRQGGNVADIDSSTCRIPNFSREVTFEIISKPDYS